MSDDIKFMSNPDFIREGYLQELNRKFLHPLGLALALDDSTNEAYIWDYRDDPEGVVFDKEVLRDPEALRKQQSVRETFLAHRDAREALLEGEVVQVITGSCDYL